MTPAQCVPGIQILHFPGGRMLTVVTGACDHVVPGSLLWKNSSVFSVVWGAAPWMKTMLATSVYTGSPDPLKR